MTIWGKVIGSVAGFALGGPLGALLGVAAGHVADKIRQPQDGNSVFSNATKQVAFTVGVIALSAKMAKADGVVTRDEIDAFKEVFHIPQKDVKSVGRIFDEAKNDSGGFEPYARQIGTLFKNEPAVLEELIGGLFHIAKADGVVHPAELDFLKKVAAIFGFSDGQFHRLQSLHMPPSEADPYEILGVSRADDNDAIKKAYRQLLRENHPDKLMAKGLPQEFIDLANEKVAAFNTAWDRIRKERGIS